MSGIRQMLWMQQCNMILIGFRSGSVGLFNFHKKKLEFSTEPGHYETIFDIQLKPADENLLATCSYDGTAKIWDVRTMKVKITLNADVRASSKGIVGNTYQEGKSCLYGISWSHSQDLISASSAKGELFIFDTVKGKLIDKWAQDLRSPIFRIQWNPRNDSQIAYGSTE